MEFLPDSQADIDLETSVELARRACVRVGNPFL